jgi:Zn-finger nucleic acid-binding protein
LEEDLGAVLPVEAVLQAAGKRKEIFMQCPNCKTDKLSGMEINNVNIDICRKCKGMWLDKGELEKIIFTKAGNFEMPSDAKQKERICPRCEQLMFEFYYPQTSCLIDMCKKCRGIWLDYKELREIKEKKAVSVTNKNNEKVKKDTPAGAKGSIVNFVNSTLKKLTDSKI